jgi:hypothetical protein
VACTSGTAGECLVSSALAPYLRLQSRAASYGEGAVAIVTAGAVRVYCRSSQLQKSCDVSMSIEMQSMIAGVIGSIRCHS